MKDVGFSKGRVVGNPVQTTKVYGLREVDEIVIFDVSARDAGRPPDFATIKRMCSSCFLPTTLGGGIRDVSDAKKLVRECGFQIWTLFFPQELMPWRPGRYGSSLKTPRLKRKSIWRQKVGQ